MGVPAFFRWLSRKFPSIVVHCVEEKGREVNGVKAPVDTSQPNPNDYEFDNLYLDMNGIIHPCCHPENKPAPKNEDEMMVAIFEYIDRIFSIVRPRKLLYMAIDGVAPRAKMNQQRSRRFRAAKESREKVEEISRIRNELKQKGAVLPPEKEKTEHFDSNCITPGTEFMANLSKCLRYYISERLNNDPGWKNIKVILSDATVPGEGEHKIMEYIRRQRASPDHDPNTRHCLNGADADLIMLGLATHELHFTIIREEFKPNQPRPCDICGQLGHMMDECMGLPKEKQGEHDELPAVVGTDVEFIFIRLNVLREYLERQLRMEGLPFGYDFERCLDDWVFMCFFVGNDFLPHLPSLQIREGAIDRLVTLYKKVIPTSGGYLAENGVVNLSRVQRILSELGYVEDEIFKKRQEDNIAFKRRMKAKKEREKRQRMSDQGPLWTPSGQFSPQPLGSSPFAVTSPRQQAYDMRRQGMQSAGSATSRDNHSAAASLRAMLTPTPDGSLSAPNTPASTPGQTPPGTGGEKRKKADDDDADPPDNIRLWEDGWKGRYYTNKFGVSQDDEEFDGFRNKVGDAYVEGLCWVLLYYYQGCPSWTWYYPYHYAPFASDFKDIGRLPNSFPRGTKPFKPLEQLMGVFPAASGNFLPPTWRSLMSHPESPIIDFYPVDFDIDLNGKKYAWQGVALLPFVDEKRLLGALATVYDDLTDEERNRNQRGKDRLFVRSTYSAADFFRGLYEGGNAAEAIDVVTDLTHGMAGRVEPDTEPILPNVVVLSPLPNLRDLASNQTISVRFSDPQYPEDFLFKARVLPGVNAPPRVLKPEGYDDRNSFRPNVGMSANRTSFGSLDSSAKRMMNFQFNRNSGPPSLMGAGPSCSGQYGRSSSNPGTPLSSRDLRRSSYDSSRNQYNSSNPYRRGNQFYTPPASWSQAPMRGQQAQLDQSGGRYSAGHSWYGQGGRGPPSHDYYGNAQSRDPRLHHRPQPPPPRDDRRHSYPLSNNRYRPY